MKPLLIGLGLYNAANGLFMLIAPRVWFETIPGASHTGPFNPHFIADIAIAFLAAAAGLVLAGFLKGRDCIPALLPSAIFLGGHAILHVTDWAHHRDLLAFEALTIVLPGLLPSLFLIMILRKD